MVERKSPLSWRVRLKLVLCVGARVSDPDYWTLTGCPTIAILPPLHRQDTYNSFSLDIQDIITSNDDTHWLSNHCYPSTCTQTGYIYRYQCWVFPTTMQGFQNLKETMFQNTITIFESFLQMPHLDRQQNLWRARIWNYFSDIAAQTNMTELFQNISEHF